MYQSVSCILLSRNRLYFAQQATWYFLRQDYPDCELLVADDGDGALAQVIPSDERIRYVRVPTECRTLGAKRNFANAQANGNLIAHWDDDDRMAPARISVQVDALNASGADICGVRDLLYYALYEGQAWYYRFPQADRVWLAGNTLMYRREAWRDHPFPDQHIGEDSAFLAQFDPHRIHTLRDNSFIVGVIHPQNTAPKRLLPPIWERRPLDEVTRLFGADRDFYIQLRHGKARPPRPLDSAPDLTFCAPFEVNSGYGSMAEYTALGMAREGARVHLRPIGLKREGLTEEFLALLQASGSAPNQPVLYYCWVRPELDWFAHTRDLFVNTMWEADRLPNGWAQRYNKARAVIVPTGFVANAMRASGVTVPVIVIPEGIDPTVYHFVERPERHGVVTLVLAPVDERKNTHIGIAAWKLAFKDDPDARLIIKTSYGYHNYTPDDPRIQYVDQLETTRGMLHWYQQADVLMALGNEGFGLPLVEGMASGLPVIALNSEGQANVCDDAPDCVLPVPPAEFRPYVHPVFGKSGARGVPSAREVADRLRWIADHREEAREIGRRASVWATDQRNIWDKGARVLDVIETYLARPLRRQRMMWTPSWGGECGIAEYTAHLVNALRGGAMRVRVAKTAPDPAGVKLLHVQQEHSLFDETGLTQIVQRMRAASIPVIITEHAITPTVQVWSATPRSSWHIRPPEPGSFAPAGRKSASNTFHKAARRGFRHASTNAAR